MDGLNSGKYKRPEPQPQEALADSAEDLRVLLRQTPPHTLTETAGCEYHPNGPEQGELALSFFGAQVRLPYPELVARWEGGTPLPLYLQAMLLYYLTTGDGTPPVNKWASFSELPGGIMYSRAFQGYSGDKIVRAFGGEIERFKQACLAAGGQPAEGGDAAFRFTPLPRLPLLVNYWLGEDEFPPACKILFDAAATHYLPIDVCAIYGSQVVSRIIKSAPAK